MRVVVFGATGNVGTSLLEALASEERVEEIVAVARRAPGREFPRTTFVAADIASSELAPIVRGADAVVHLAALQQSDGLAVADHGNDEFPQAGMAAIAQRPAVATGLEKFRLVTHGAQRLPAGECV